MRRVHRAGAGQRRAHRGAVRGGRGPGHPRPRDQRGARHAARPRRDRREPARRRQHHRHRLRRQGAAPATPSAPPFAPRAPPAGSTLILAAASHTISGSLYSKLPYHPINDFTAVAHIGTVDYVLMTSSTIPAKSAADFVAYARANPGKLNYASAGNGSATHLAMAHFASLAGIELVHVPFKATGEAINEVLAARAHAVIAANIGALAFVRDERVPMLSSTGSPRSKILPRL